MRKRTQGTCSVMLFHRCRRRDHPLSRAAAASAGTRMY
jgi:hypothetical protein